jgi:outer membrane receptor protein involved in Fe transport
MGGLQYLVLLAMMCGMSIAARAASIRGTVEGPRGAVAGAAVTLLQQGREIQKTVSGADGAFVFENVQPGAYQLQTALAPFVPVVNEITVADAAQQVEQVVTLAGRSDAITVTAGRLPVAVTSASAEVKVLTETDLRDSPYQTLDDRMRSFPEFSLFRRSSSLVANPTTQGVSLRGIGPSGVSRSLVLLDGIPLNDAFGGWVYWDRVPLLSVEQVEIASGGQSSLYGNYGLGGVIQLLSKIPEEARMDIEVTGGSHYTRSAEFAASDRAGPWGVSASGSFFDFDGYHVVAEEQRGSVDIKANSSHQAMRFGVERAASSAVWTLQGGFLRENRSNGTPLTPNSTHSFDASTGAQWSVGSNDRVEARTFFRRTIFASHTSAVAAGRNSERLTVQQHVPSADGGAAVQWFTTRGRHRLVLGSDLWMVSGASRDNAFAATGVVTIRVGGGKQATAGIFLEDNIAISPATTLFLGARLDLWRNYDGDLTSFAPGAEAPASALPATTRGVLSPSAGFSHDVNSNVSIYGSAQRSFRAPTLNELYRGFGAGNIVTNPNSALVPEYSTGGQFGSRFRSRDTHLGFSFEASLAGFWTRLEQPVSNVTQQITATQIIRQRQNLGNARIYGVQAGFDLHTLGLRLRGSYLWDRAVVTDFAADSALEGNRLPQVPEHRFTIQSESPLPASFQLTLIGRFVGNQFDDDLNTLALSRFFQLDAQVARTLGETGRLFVAMENLTDAEILTSRTPVNFTGPPFAIRAGIHLQIGRR